jgi:hypothetical protein
MFLLCLALASAQAAPVEESAEDRLFDEAYRTILATPDKEARAAAVRAAAKQIGNERDQRTERIQQQKNRKAHGLEESPSAPEPIGAVAPPPPDEISFEPRRKPASQPKKQH